MANTGASKNPTSIEVYQAAATKITARINRTNPYSDAKLEGALAVSRKNIEDLYKFYFYGSNCW